MKSAVVSTFLSKGNSHEKAVSRYSLDKAESAGQDLYASEGTGAFKLYSEFDKQPALRWRGSRQDGDVALIDVGLG